MAHPRVWLHPLAVLGVGALLGGALSPALAARPPDPYAQLDVFAQALTWAAEQHVDEVAETTLIDGAIQGMTDRLDEHSTWLSADDFAMLQEDTAGRYEGIGIEGRTVPAGLLVTRTLQGGPAYRDGVRAGDRIITVNDESLAGVDLDDVVAHLRGPRGTPLRLTLLGEDGQTRVVDTIRDRIDVQAVEAGPLPAGVAYVHLRSFQEHAARDVEREARSLWRAGQREALVLDLRGNGGGLLREAVALADLFLDEGVIVSTRGRRGAMAEETAAPGGLPQDWPIIVLVDRASASASEVVAGALQDTGRATLVGTRTFGKGTVQTLFHAPGGRALKLTTARYYTPSGKPVAPETGRVPDLRVPSPITGDPHRTLDVALAKADLPEGERTRLRDLLARIPHDDPEPILPWATPVEKRWQVDPQLRAALEHLGVDLPPPSPEP